MMSFDPINAFVTLIDWMNIIFFLILIIFLVDDILVCSKTLNDHMHHLWELFQILQENELND